jgi:hypothetical protein
MLSRRIVAAILLTVFVLAVLVRSSEAGPGPEIVVTVNSNKQTGTNKLSLGFMLDYEWRAYASDSVRRELAASARLKLARVFDFRDESPRPCTYWNESAKAGVFVWSDLDVLVQRIVQIGAEPLFCLGTARADGPKIPAGMAVDPDTNLPYPASFAAYASEWVRHFRAVGLPARLYEIMNEPWEYFGGEPVDFAKLGNYMRLFNSVAAAMRRENPDIMISQDYIIRKPVLDYWLANGGIDVDYLDFHKYGDWIVGQKTEAEILRDAEEEYFGTWPMGYSIEEARRIWFSARGKLLPVINSEHNFNAAWETGTDPRIQQMIGAVWTASVLRMSILNGLTYSVYYSLSGSSSYGKSTQTGGAGFGMIDADNNQPWYPYYVHYMLGRNMGAGDSLIEATSSSSDVRAVAWVHNGILNLFLICKVNELRTIRLGGMSGEASFLKIDNTVPWITPVMQSGVTSTAEALTMNGYTVMLLSASTPTTTTLATTTSATSSLTTTSSASISVFTYARPTLTVATTSYSTSHQTITITQSSGTVLTTSARVTVYTSGSATSTGSKQPTTINCDVSRLQDSTSSPPRLRVSVTGRLTASTVGVPKRDLIIYYSIKGYPGRSVKVTTDSQGNFGTTIYSEVQDTTVNVDKVEFLGDEMYLPSTWPRARSGSVTGTTVAAGIPVTASIEPPYVAE